MWHVEPPRRRFFRSSEEVYPKTYEFFSITRCSGKFAVEWPMSRDESISWKRESGGWNEVSEDGYRAVDPAGTKSRPDG